MKNSTALRLNRIFPAVLISALFFVNDSASAQSGNKYATGLNSLTATDGLGSYNYEGLNFYTNAVKRGAFTKDGEFEALYKAHFYADLKCDSIIRSWKAQTDNLRVFGNAVIDSTLQAQRLEADAISIDGNANITDTLNIGLLTLTGNRISSSNGTISFSGNNLVKAGTLIATTVDAQTYLLSGTAIDFNAMDSTDKALQVQIDSIETAVGGITSSQWQNTSQNSISYIGNATVNGTFQANNINTALLTISDKFTAPKGEFDTLRAERQLSINHNLKLGRDSGSITESDIASKIDVLKIQSDPNVAFDVVMAEGNEAKIGIGVKEGLTAKLNVLGGTRLNGDLQVTGNSTFSGDIILQGTIEANTVNASNINLNGTPFSGQFLRLSGDTMKGNVTFDNNSALNHSTSNGLLRFNNPQGENIIGLGYNLDDPATQQGFLIAPSGYKGNPNGSFAFGDANPNGQIILALGTGQSGTRINLDGAGKRLILQNDGGDKFSMGGVNAPTLWESTQGFNLAPRSGFSGTHLLDVQGSINAQQYYVNGTLIDVAAIDSTLDTLQLALSGIQTSQWQKDTMNTGNIFYNSGNIGIGTSAPVTKLDVFGDQRITGNLFVGGELSVSDKFSAKTIVADTIKPPQGSDKITVAAPMQAEAIRVDTLLVSEKFTAANSVSSDTLVAVKQLEVNHNLSLGSDSGSTESDVASKISILTIQSDPAKAYNTAINADNTGMVGIGTRYPTEKLSVDGNVSVSGNMQANQITTSYLTISDGFSAPRGDFDSLNVLKEFTSSARIKSDTMVALRQLDVNHNLSLGSDSGSVESDIASKVANLTIQSDPAATYNVVMSADNNTRVGIGDKYPTEKLSVQGNVKVSGDIVTAGNVTANCVTTSCLNVSGQTFFDSVNVTTKVKTSRIVPPDGDSIIAFGNNTLLFNTFSHNIYTDDVGPFKGIGIGAGSVGIGTNSLAFGMGSVSAAPGSIIIGNSTVGSFQNLNQNSLMVGFNTIGTTPTLFVGPADGTLNSIGDVGIGTSNPQSELDVKGTGLFSDKVGIGTTTPVAKLHIKHDGTPAVRFQITGSSPFDIVQDYNDGLTFVRSNLKILHLGDFGNVGIGTTEPHQKLDVAGHISLVDHLVFNSTSTHGVINWPASKDLWFRTNATSGDINNYTTRMIIKGDGRVGIGKETPNDMLDVAGNLKIGASASENTIKFYGLTGDDPGNYTNTVIAERLYNFNGSDADHSELLFFKGNDPDNCGTPPPHGSCGDRIRFDTPGSILFQTGNGFRSYSPTTEGITRMIINSDGTVGIGTSCVPAGFSLAVKGKIKAKEVEIDVTNGWCDYVFEADYNITNWQKKLDFLKKNKHLPGLESGKEIENNGLKTGETMKGILFNVEENTLDIIELYRMNEQLMEIVKKQNEEIILLKKGIEKK